VRLEFWPATLCWLGLFKSTVVRLSDVRAGRLNVVLAPQHL
jgi:hypothetical protein